MSEDKFFDIESPSTFINCVSAGFGPDKSLVRVHFSDQYMQDKRNTHFSAVIPAQDFLKICQLFQQLADSIATPIEVPHAANDSQAKMGE